MSDEQRPGGVMALAILEFLLGVLLVAGFMFSFFPRILRNFRPNDGGILLMLAIADFVLAYGLWSGKGWAWITALIFALLGIIFSGFMLFIRPALGQLVSMIVELLIVCYLLQPKVQRHFRKLRSLEK